MSSGAVAGATAGGGGPPAPGTPTTPAVDVVVAEAETFLGRGPDLVRRVSRLYPGAAIVLLVDRTSPIDVWAAFSRGVRGHVLSTAPVAQVVEAVLGVYRGGRYLLLATLATRWMPPEDSPGQGPS